VRFLATIYDDERSRADAPPERYQEMLAAYGAFGQEAGDRVLAGEGLEPTTSAKTIRVQNGERLVTDGPFAETKEQLGGFYLLECSGLDEAVDLAAKIPGASTGCVEVRPVVDYSEGEASS
jgi:hypothetical protein